MGGGSFQVPKTNKWSQFYVSMWSSGPDPQATPAFFTERWQGTFPSPLDPGRDVLIYLNLPRILLEGMYVYHDSTSHLLISTGRGGFIPSCYIFTAWYFVEGQEPVCLTELPYAAQGPLPLPLGSPSHPSAFEAADYRLSFNRWERTVFDAGFCLNGRTSPPPIASDTENPSTYTRRHQHARQYGLCCRCNRLRLWVCLVKKGDSWEHHRLSPCPPSGSLVSAG